jgi:hypothetical protein|tara:strand:- start:385 stop:519 length:135 start_codon:yes stop_codon:yes gene_type:complete
VIIKEDLDQELKEGVLDLEITMGKTQMAIFNLTEAETSVEIMDQ